MVDSIFLGIWRTLFVTGSRFITEKLPDIPTPPTKHSHRKHHQETKGTESSA